MIWSDSGIVLSNRKHGENLKIVSIFTKEHGRVAAMSKIINRNAFSLLSNVTVELIKQNSSDDIGFWLKKYEKQNWIYIFNIEICLLICQSICLILDKILPPGVKFIKLFCFLEFLLKYINTLSEKELLILYAYFEFIVLEESGFGFDLNCCSICHKKEKTEFISPKTGRTASKQCCFLHINKLFRVPEVWHFWGNNSGFDAVMQCDIGEKDLYASLEITWYFLRKNILDFPNYFRNKIMSQLL